MLLARHRRARVVSSAADAHTALDAHAASSAWDRMDHKVSRSEALSQAKTELLGDNVDDRFVALSKQDEIEHLLAELKTKKE